MTASMPWQKINLPATHLAADQRVRWRSKRRVYFVFGRIAQLFHLIQTAPADDPDRWRLVVHLAPRLNPKDRQDEKWIMAQLARPCIIFAMSMPKFFIRTYGCQMNERDSEQVAHSLMTRGYERVAKEAEADVVLLNTCSVRDMADQKALGKMGMLGRVAKERRNVVFGFLGCMAQARGESLLKNLPHVDLVVGTQKFHRVADYVEELVARKGCRRMDDPRFSIVDVGDEP